MEETRKEEGTRISKKNIAGKKVKKVCKLCEDKTFNFLINFNTNYLKTREWKTGMDPKLFFKKYFSSRVWDALWK